MTVLCTLTSGAEQYTGALKGMSATYLEMHPDNKAAWGGQRTKAGVLALVWQPGDEASRDVNGRTRVGAYGCSLPNPVNPAVCLKHFPLKCVVVFLKCSGKKGQHMQTIQGVRRSTTVWICMISNSDSSPKKHHTQGRCQ